MNTEDTQPAHREMHCSFCRKSQVEVGMMVGGPGVSICDRCVEAAAKVLAENEGKPITEQSMFQDYWPSERLLSNLKLYDNAFAHMDRSMQDVVDILREREVSWAKIGEALGVSRQAAWKRFG